MNLALSTLQKLICHKTQQTKQNQQNFENILAEEY